VPDEWRSTLGQRNGVLSARHMNTASSSPGAASPGALGAPGKPTLVAAAIIGNMLELYDFVVYGFFATALAFFPAGDEVTSLLLTVATFGVGFFMRPLGAIVIGS
jgi:MHS family proline/betaine transporter-like MFS transporter